MITEAKCQRVGGDVIGVAEFNPNHCLRLPKMLDDYIRDHGPDHSIDIPQHHRDYDAGLSVREQLDFAGHSLGLDHQREKSSAAALDHGWPPLAWPPECQRSEADHAAD